jgi:hypothetical protein
MSIDLLTSYKTTTCCIKDCHISFAMTDEFYNKKLKDKSYFCCPNGHSQYFITETEEEKLKKEINRLENKVEFIRNCKKTLEYSRRHWKGEVTKLKRGKE